MSDEIVKYSNQFNNQALPLLWLLESGLVAIARLLLYLRLLGQVTNLFPQLTRRLSAGEPHARVRGPCAQFGGMGLEHVQQPWN